MKNVKRLAAALSLAVACTAPALAHRDSDDEDASFSELSAQWWQWAFSIPHAVNPLEDATGANCSVGQRGSVWFLAGAFDDLKTPAARVCTIPEGVDLYFPIVNFVWVNTPECDEPVFTVAELRDKVAPVIDGASGLSVQLDGRRVKNIRRVRSQPFVTTLPGLPGTYPDLFSVAFGGLTCLNQKVYWPSVDDGYYVRLRGLRAGEHHLHIVGTTGVLPSTGRTNTIDIFYTLNVVRGGPKRDRD